MAITNDEVIDRANKWARLHANPKWRNRMDEALKDLDESDQRRVYLCGQRVAAGMPLKIVPAPPEPTPSPTTKGGEKNGNRNNNSGKPKPKGKRKQGKA